MPSGNVNSQSVARTGRVRTRQGEKQGENDFTDWPYGKTVLLQYAYGVRNVGASGSESHQPGSSQAGSTTS